MKLLIVLRVEDTDDLIRKADEKRIEENTQQGGDEDAEPQGSPDVLMIPLSVVVADDGLYPLSDTGEDGDEDQGKVCHDAVGCHSDVSDIPENDQVEDEDHKSRGQFRDEGGYADGNDLSYDRWLKLCLHQSEAVLPSQEEGQHDQHAKQWCYACGQGSPEHAELQREDEDVVQDDVPDAGGHHGPHGQLRMSVVSHHADEDVVHHEDCGKREDGGGVFKRQILLMSSSAQKLHDLIGKEQSEDGEEKPDEYPQKDHLGEYLISLLGFLLSPVYGVDGTDPCAQEKTHGIDHRIGRNH